MQVKAGCGPVSYRRQAPRGARIPPPRAVAAIGGKAEYLLKISKKQFKVRCSYGIIKL